MNHVILESSVSVGMRATGTHGYSVDVAHGGVVKTSISDLAQGPGGWGMTHSLQEPWKRTESAGVVTS